MIFYHGSTKLFPKGFLLEPQSNGYASQDSVKDIEACMEARRPADKTPRAKSVFLVADPDLIDASGGSIDVIYQVRPKSSPEESDLAWYSDVQCALEDNPPDYEAINSLVDNYWSGAPHHDESRRCPEFRVRWAEVSSVFEINADHEDLEIYDNPDNTP